jgi:hypothetical protein
MDNHPFSPAKEAVCDTPRTDKAKRPMIGHADEWVPRYICEELERELSAAREALADCAEDSSELLGERGWWKDEPRCGFSQRYANTEENIHRAREILDQQP